jgi:hypothetical protein
MDKNEVRFAVPGVKFYLLVIIYYRDEMLAQGLTEFLFK